MHSCIILCGGRSRRMGQDKGLMNFHQKPLIIHLLETLEDQVDEMILVFRDEKQLNSYKNHITTYLSKQQTPSTWLQLVTDLEKDQGPLVGLLTGLSHIKGDGALVLPCDSPFVSQQFITNIFKINDDFEVVNEDGERNKKSKDEIKSQAIIPIWSDGSVEPLHAYYRKDCLPFIKMQLKAGYRDVKSLFNVINVNFVEVELLDPEKISFTNLNRPEDLTSVNSLKRN